ncbi:MAG: EAL domain-containing protein [Nitrospiraceae bacterium]|nr:MAG: EAL domain-containing protein [Nitrospiraceae bacterium]
MKNEKSALLLKVLLVAAVSSVIGSLTIFFVSKQFDLSQAFTLVIRIGITCFALLPLIYVFFYRKSIDSVKKREDALDKYNLISSIYENSNEAILITDMSANIIDVNETFCRITGYAREELIGKNPKIMKSDKHDREFFKDFWQTLHREGQWQGEIWDRRKDGEVFPKWLTVTAVRDSEGIPMRYVGVFSDISAIKQTEDELQFYAHYDILTRLPNRLLFHDRLQQAMMHGKRNKTFLALMYLDLDRFKNINDTLGHRIGDVLLQKVAERLQAMVRKNDTISRFGGDEFVIILPDLHAVEEAGALGQKIVDEISQPFPIENHELYISASIGITMFPSDGETEDILIRNADTAMYHAKESGKNRFHFFKKEMNDTSTERLRIEHNLRKAIEQEEFVLYYQPRVDLASENIIGMEALIRRQEPDWLMPPSYFIPLAEETGLIVPIGIWTLRTACMQTRSWQQEQGLSDLRVSVNVSAKQFHEKDFVRMVRATLEESGLEPRYLELEVTERSILTDVEGTIRILQKLKDMSIHISLDDFGTGYSSLSYLRRLPIDTLKIDRSFVMDITKSTEGTAVVKAIISLGHSLNLTVLAEGAETEAEYNFLRENGCNELQGFYFSVPLSVEAFQKFVKRKRSG